MKFVWLFVCVAAWLQGQTPSDSQLLLNEVRQLRLDLAATSVGVQRTQILLFRLQLEESAINRATQRLDQAKSQVSGLQFRVKNDADQIQGLEAEVNRTQDPTQKARLPNIITNLKKDLENMTSQVQDAQARQIDAESQLRTEQAKKDALEAALDKIDRELAALARQ